MMFLGSKFCGHCGASAYPAELLDDAEPGDCPRCKTKLQSLKIDTVQIRECEKCGGFWSGGSVFEELCNNREQQASVLGFIGSYVHTEPAPSAISYVPCPDCKLLMNRSNFARSSGVIIDMCKQHGVWFDASELQKIIEFIEKGGIGRAREKEKIALLDERARLREEQRKLAMMERRMGGTLTEGDGSLLSILFD
jgi:Zn-finger nucleic acid-binding protein